MTKEQAICILNDGVSWAYDEGMATPELTEACRQLVKDYGIRREELTCHEKQWWEPHP
jgi:hypothetical protein